MRTATTLSRWLALAMAVTGTGLACEAMAEVRPPHNYRNNVPSYRYCPPSYERTGPIAPPDGASPDEPIPGADDPARPSSPFDDSTTPATSFPSTLASASSPVAANMKGDSIGGGCGTVRFEGAIIGEVNHPFFGCSRQKIAENNSPLPRDRAYFTYQHFHNAIFNSVTDDDLNVTSNQDTSVDRFLFGVERTFWNDIVSIQLQVPFASQLGNDMLLDFVTPSAPGNTEVAFGNVSVALKAVLARDCCRKFLISGGVLVELPTASDVDLRAVDVTDVTIGGVDEPRELDFRLHFQNDSVIVSPFLAALYAPNQRFFLQGFTQIDTDVNGSDLDFNPTVTSNGVPLPTANSSFHFSGQTFMRFDVGGGVWLYRNRCAPRITGVAMLAEVHHSTTLDDADVYQVDTPGIPGGTIDFGNVANRLDITNLTFGPTFEVANRGTVGTGFVVPLSDGDNKPFDFEFQLQVDLRI